MEERNNDVQSGLSAAARRNLVESSSSLPPDKENAGANSSIRRSQSMGRQVKHLGSTPVLLTPSVAALPSRTPSRSGLTSRDQPIVAPQQQQPFTYSFCAPVSTSSAGILATTSATAVSVPRHQHHESRAVALSATTTRQQQPIPQTPDASASLSSYYCSNKLHIVIKSPPGSSKLLRKHFQHLAMTSPPRWSNTQQEQQHQQQRLLATGPVRLTPPQGHHHQKSPSATSMLAPRRVGYDGTMYTPSKELLKSTASSRAQRFERTQEEHLYYDNQLLLEDSKPPASSNLVSTNTHQDYHQLVSNADQYGDDEVPPGVSAEDDEVSYEASVSMDDMSFEVPVQYQFHGHQSWPGANNVMLPPASPLPPRQGSSNPVAMTLLNDGREDYHFLVAHDARSPTMVVKELSAVNAPSHTDASLSSGSTSISNSSSTAASLGNHRNASPAEVRGTLSMTDRSNLARPVPIMAKPSSSSVAPPSQPAGGHVHLPSQQEQQQSQYRHPAAATRLIMRSQPREVR